MRQGQAARQLELNLSRVVPDLSPMRLKVLARKGLHSYLRYYCESLEARGKYRLMIWPYHAMLGGNRSAGIGGRRRVSAATLLLTARGRRKCDHCQETSEDPAPTCRNGGHRYSVLGKSRSWQARRDTDAIWFSDPAGKTPPRERRDIRACR